MDVFIILQVFWLLYASFKMAAMGGAGADVEKGDGVGDADAGIRLFLAFIFLHQGFSKLNFTEII